ncbi:MAG: hypothetical protein Q4G49_01520 [Paracoccus sp. (in: a-proteobacteria)]|nr:hypothetical protein [Paracoccus sp. (in: a-proteobacteria)]
MHDDPALDKLRERIGAAPLGPAVEERGTVIALAHGLATVSGLMGAGLNEILIFEGSARALVLTMEEDRLNAAFLDPADGIAAGSAVIRSGCIASVPVGPALLGRVLDPLARPLDDMPAPDATEALPVERHARRSSTATSWRNRLPPAFWSSTRCSPSGAASAS